MRSHGQENVTTSRKNPEGEIRGLGQEQMNNKKKKLLNIMVVGMGGLITICLSCILHDPIVYMMSFVVAIGYCITLPFIGSPTWTV